MAISHVGRKYSENIPQAFDQVIFFVVGYFTKWIEVELVATISTERIQRFYWKKIIYRFGLPSKIVTDNGTQLVCNSVLELCSQWGLKKVFTSTEYPQTHGLAEVSNKLVLSGLKKN